MNYFITLFTKTSGAKVYSVKQKLFRRTKFVVFLKPQQNNNKRVLANL